MVTESEEIRGVGHSVRRVEDDRFIRGRGNYIDDINLKGQLYMSILRSPVGARDPEGHRRLARPPRCPAWWPSSPAS